MVIRPKVTVVDPLMLLAFLRHPATVARLQLMIRGQTAHLMPADVCKLDVPEWIVRPDATGERLRELLREEAQLALRLNAVASGAEALLESVAWD